MRAACVHARALPRVSPSRPLGRNEQHEDEDEEREHVLPLAAEDGGAVVLEQPEEQAAEQRAADVADAAEHRGGERLDAGEEADVVAGRLEEDGEQEPGGAGEQPAEQEREHDDAVDVDAHELGRLGVLRGGPDAAAEPAAPDELVEADHQDDGGDDHQHLVACGPARPRPRTRPTSRAPAPA